MEGPKPGHLKDLGEASEEFVGIRITAMEVLEHCDRESGEKTVIFRRLTKVSLKSSTK